jgi:hypothetical protein
MGNKSTPYTSRHGRQQRRWRKPETPPPPETDKSFLVPFFKKEHLP